MYQSHVVRSQTSGSICCLHVCHDTTVIDFLKTWLNHLFLNLGWPTTLFVGMGLVVMVTLLGMATLIFCRKKIFTPSGNTWTRACIIMFYVYTVCIVHTAYANTNKHSKHTLFVFQNSPTILWIQLLLRMRWVLNLWRVLCV